MSDHYTSGAHPSRRNNLQHHSSNHPFLNATPHFLLSSTKVQHGSIYHAPAGDLLDQQTAYTYGSYETVGESSKPNGEGAESPCENSRVSMEVGSVEHPKIAKVLIVLIDRPILVYGITAYVGISVYERLVLDPLDRALEQEMKDLPTEELEEDKPIFIPFPGTTKELKPKPYRGTDPEWKEFVKFSKDRPLQDRVRG
jgi:hypothetical protein